VFTYLSSYLDLETAKGPFRSSSQAATCYYQPNYSKEDAIPVSALSKDTTSKLVGLSSHYPFFMLNVKQGSCEYQLLKYFGLTRPGNQAQVYRLWGKCSNHQTTHHKNLTSLFCPQVYHARILFKYNHFYLSETLTG